MSAHEIRGRRLAQRLEDVRHDNGLVRLPEVDRFISREFEGSGSATRSRSRSTLKRFWTRRENKGGRLQVKLAEIALTVFASGNLSGF